MAKEKEKNYISLIEAAKLCSYSEPYLRLRARQGKLKSIKLGKKWMTTVAWLGDYERRVREWREKAEIKKEKNVSAVFVSAPAEISQVIAFADIQAPQQGIVAPETAPKPQKPGIVIPYKNELLPPRAPKRPLPAMPSGQIYPVPRQTPVKEIASLGWFGALVSGALCALALFLAANPDGILNLIDAGSAGPGQANISRPAGNISKEETITPALPLPDSQIAGPPLFDRPQIVLGSDPLKDFVDAVDNFLKDLFQK